VYKSITVLTLPIADRKEFIKISQAVGVGFIAMGVIGYVIKLSRLLLETYPSGVTLANGVCSTYSGQ
jgi:protein translocase SEC61 complex gamma subunit